MVVKMNFRIITKKYTADPEIRLLTKSILELFGLTTALELRVRLIKFKIRLTYKSL